jgi:hypothetical protein
MRAYFLNFLTGSAGALIASAAARALPEPGDRGSRVYLWFYRFAHFILANFDKSVSPGFFSGDVHASKSGGD